MNFCENKHRCRHPESKDRMTVSPHVHLTLSRNISLPDIVECNDPASDMCGTLHLALEGAPPRKSIHEFDSYLSGHTACAIGKQIIIHN